MDDNKKKVVVGISGGVDSALSAYFLKNSFQFREVCGIFMRNWDDFVFNNKSKTFSKCTQVDDWKDAKKVCEFVNIPLDQVTFAKEYWENVFLKFISDMKIGLTPNPDILCNKFIKFSCFFEYAREKMNADYVATGHYARIKHDIKKNTFYLAKSKDEQKDQTYFLCWINISVLPFLIFPLSEINKKEVRKIASEVGIPNSKKKDSTGICFIGENNFPSFIQNFLDNDEGDIVSLLTMKRIGYHKGHFFFTIGQRKGLNIFSNEETHYVVAKDVEKKIVYVTPSSRTEFLYSNWCFVKDANWLVSNEDLMFFLNRKVFVKFRHRQKEIKANVVFLNESEGLLKVNLDEQVRAITPGQFAVFYYGEICLGGAVVSCSEKLNEKSNLWRKF